MAESSNNVVETINRDCHDFKSLLSSSDRDFLVRNNGDQVIGSLTDIYLSALLKIDFINLLLLGSNLKGFICIFV